MRLEVPMSVIADRLLRKIFELKGRIDRNRKAVRMDWIDIIRDSWIAHINKFWQDEWMLNRWTLAAHLDLTHMQDVTTKYTVLAETLNERECLV